MEGWHTDWGGEGEGKRRVRMWSEGKRAEEIDWGWSDDDDRRMGVCMVVNRESWLCLWVGLRLEVLYVICMLG